jgi:hypothetical protein
MSVAFAAVAGKKVRHSGTMLTEVDTGSTITPVPTSGLKPATVVEFAGQDSRIALHHLMTDMNVAHSMPG